MRFKCRMEIDYARFFPWYIFWCTIFLFHRSTCHSISVAGLSFVHLRPDPLHTKTHFPTHRVKNHQKGSIKTDSIKDISQTNPYEKSKMINWFDFVFLSFTIFPGARWLVLVYTRSYTFLSAVMIWELMSVDGYKWKKIRSKRLLFLCISHFTKCKIYIAQ